MINTNTGQVGEPVPSGMRASLAYKFARRTGVAQNNTNDIMNSIIYGDLDESEYENVLIHDLGKHHR